MMIGVLTTPPRSMLRPTADSQRQQRGGLSSQPHCWFSTGKFYRSSSHLLLSPSPTATSGSFYFLFYISPFCFCTAAFPFMPWNYARCILLPLQTILLPSLFCSSFWYLPMLLSPSLWPGSRLSSAVWPHVQEDAAKLGAFALIGQGGRKQGLAHGDVPGAWWRWHNWLWESFARCHGRQMADSLFLYLRERQLGAHGLGAVRGRGKLREARELGNQSQGWRDRGCNWEERKRWVVSSF